MGKVKYEVDDLFEMGNAVWKGPEDEPKEGYCHIVKFKGLKTPQMAMYAGGRWFIKEGMTIEKYCEWPK